MKSENSKRILLISSNRNNKKPEQGLYHKHKNCNNSLINSKVSSNAIVQAKVECKQLKLGHSKCFNMHTGKKSKYLCPTLSIHGEKMFLSEKPG